MKDVMIDLLTKAIIEKFSEYQIEWLTNHCDIEFVPEEEELIVGFLKDTASCFISEYTE